MSSFDKNFAKITEFKRSNLIMKNMYTEYKLTPPVYWTYTAESGDCKLCAALDGETYFLQPERPHPNCKCQIVEYNKHGYAISLNEVYKRYYVIGRRNLEKLDGSINTLRGMFKSFFEHEIFEYGTSPKGTLQKIDNFISELGLMAGHEHFFSNDGINFGLLADSRVQPDTADLNKYPYRFEPTKYDAELIEKARQAIDDFLKIKIRQMENLDPHLMQRGSYYIPVDAYNLLTYNCQHYVSWVLDVAGQIAKKEGKQLILPW